MASQRSLFTVIATCIVCALAVATDACAAGYPSRLIRVIMPYPAGSGADQGMRAIADYMETRIKVPVIVENVTGAEGDTAARRCATADPDGYTLCVLSYGHLVVRPAMREELHQEQLYDPSAFVPIARTLFSDFFLMTNAKVGGSIAEMKTYSASHGSITIGTNSAVTVMAAQALAPLLEGAVLIPNGRGMSESTMLLLLGGHIDAAFVSLPAAREYRNDPRVRIVGVFGTERSEFEPGIPSLSEQTNGLIHLPDSWAGIFGPPGFGTGHADVLDSLIRDALRDPVVSARIKMLLNKLSYAGRSVFQQQVRDSIAAGIR